MSQLMETLFSFWKLPSSPTRKRKQSERRNPPSWRPNSA